MSKTTIFNLIKILYTLVTILVLSLIAGFVFSWTSPSAIPPNDNVDAPLNTGSSGQTKEGGLILNTGGANNGLTVKGTSTFMGPISIGVNNTGTAGQVLQSGGPGNPPEWANGVGGGSWSFIEQKMGDIPCFECSPSTSVAIPAGTKYIIGYLGAYTSEGGYNSNRLQGPITMVINSKDSTVVKESFDSSSPPGATGSVQAVVNGSNLDLTTSISGTGGSTGHLTYELYFYKDNGGSGNSVVTLTAGETINGATTPVPVYIQQTNTITPDEMKISQEEWSTSQRFYTYQFGQSFTTGTYTNRLTKIYINLSINGSPSGNFNMGIYEASGGLPTGSPLVAETVTAASLINGWNEFQFTTPLVVSPSTQYVIVFDHTNDNGSNYIRWSYHQTENPYGGGTFLHDFGSGWGIEGGHDFTFQVYGYYVFDPANDGKIFKSEADDVYKLNYIGFATTDAMLGDNVEVQTSGIVDGFTGLTIGEKYYIQNTIGTIGTTAGDAEILVGFAVSNTQLYIQKGSYEYISSASCNHSRSDNQYDMTCSVVAPLSAKNAVFKSRGHYGTNGGQGMDSVTNGTLVKRGATSMYLSPAGNDVFFANTHGDISWSGDTITANLYIYSNHSYNASILDLKVYFYK